MSCLDQRVILPTKEECERVSRGTCRAEFNLAKAFGFGDILPDCNELPSSSPQDISGIYNIRLKFVSICEYLGRGTNGSYGG